MGRTLLLGMAGIVASAALAAALLSHAGQNGGPRKVTVGIVQFSTVDNATVEGFKAALSGQAFGEGVSVVFRHGGAAGSQERLQPLIDETLSQRVDLVMVASTPATRAVVAATRDRRVPVIFAPVNDPVEAGIVTDLAHPGGHVTGIRLPPGEDLRLQWLTRIAPEAKAVLTPYVPSDKSSVSTVGIISRSAPALGVEVRAAPVGSCEDVQQAIAAHAGWAQAIFLPRDSLVEACVDGIVAAAERLRIPVAAPSITQVHKGALFSYGFIHAEIGHRAARLAGQVLRGVPPGDLPVESAESYLAINPKAAAAIGMPLPNDILALADIVVRD